MSKNQTDSNSAQRGFLDIISAIVLAVLLVGIPITTYLAQHKQDVRKYAMEDSGGGGGGGGSDEGNTPDSTTDTAPPDDAASGAYKEVNTPLNTGSTTNPSGGGQGGSSGFGGDTSNSFGLKVAPGTFITYDENGLPVISNNNSGNSANTPVSISTDPTGKSAIVYTTDPTTGKITASIPNDPMQKFYTKDPTTGLSTVNPSDYMAYIKSQDYQFFPTGQDVTLALQKGIITPELVIGGASIIAAPAALFGGEAALTAISGPLGSVLAPAATVSEIPTALYIAGSNALANSPAALQTAVALSGPASLIAIAVGCSSGNKAACEGTFVIGSQYLGDLQATGSIIKGIGIKPSTAESFPQPIIDEVHPNSDWIKIYQKLNEEAQLKLASSGAREGVYYKGIKQYEPGTNILPGGLADRPFSKYPTGELTNEEYSLLITSGTVDIKKEAIRHMIEGDVSRSPFSSWTPFFERAEYYAGRNGTVVSIEAGSGELISGPKVVQEIGSPAYVDQILFGGDPTFDFGPNYVFAKNMKGIIVNQEQLYLGIVPADKVSIVKQPKLPSVR